MAKKIGPDFGIVRMPGPAGRVAVVRKEAVQAVLYSPNSGVEVCIGGGQSTIASVDTVEDVCNDLGILYKGDSDEI